MNRCRELNTVSPATAGKKATLVTPNEICVEAKTDYIYGNKASNASLIEFSQSTEIYTALRTFLLAYLWVGPGSGLAHTCPRLQLGTQEKKTSGSRMAGNAFWVKPKFQLFSFYFVEWTGVSQNGC